MTDDAIRAAVKAGVCRSCHDAIKGLCRICGYCGACGHDVKVDHHPEA